MKIRCSQCDYIIDDSAISCSYCFSGQGLEALGGIDPLIRFKSQKLTVWFSLLLGGFGVHKFYLGQYFYGICYLVFCWTFIPAVLGVVEGIRTFKMSAFSFEQRYCRKIRLY